MDDSLGLPELDVKSWRNSERESQMNRTSQCQLNPTHVLNITHGTEYISIHGPIESLVGFNCIS